MRSANEISAELIASGLTSGQTALLMELVLSMSTGLSTGQHSGENRAIENRRAWDRDRKARQRADREARKLSIGSGGKSAFSTGSPVDSGGIPPDFLAVTPTEEVTSRSIQGEERKKTRGSRLLSGARVNEENRVIAIENGCPPGRVDALWSEFVDYWADIPGQRGCKISWVGTWRNRVKQVFGKGFMDGKASHPRRGAPVGFETLFQQPETSHADTANYPDFDLDLTANRPG